jgi:hypothetical protein
MSFRQFKPVFLVLIGAVIAQLLNRTNLVSQVTFL